jgi:hypothetical protein
MGVDLSQGKQIITMMNCLELGLGTICWYDFCIERKQNSMMGGWNVSRYVLSEIRHSICNRVKVESYW